MAVGTLTAMPIAGPREINRRTARAAMALAPVAALPLGFLAAGVGTVGRWAGLSPLIVAVLVVGAVALGCRGLHLDGLADTADGLAASYQRDRALEVMRKGDTGPAGMAAVLLVVFLQIAAMSVVLGRPWGAVVAGIAVVLSRAALSVACRVGVPAARRDGLGAAVAGVVPIVVTVITAALAAAVAAASMVLTDRPWWQGLLAVGAAGAVVAALIRRCVRRFGGITGDVLGAAVETALAALLVVSAAGSL